MSREAHVRFWEGVGVRFPRATRQKRDAFRTNFKTGLNLPAKCASCIVIHDRIPVPPEIAKVDERYLVSTLATGFLYNFAGQA